LGASRGRVARQLITESVLLALVGGALSLLLVFWLIKLLTGLLPAGMPQGTSITIDANVLLYSLTLSLAAGLLFGLAPIFQAFPLGSSSQLRQCLGSRRQLQLTIYHSEQDEITTNSSPNGAEKKTCSARLGDRNNASEVQSAFG